MVRKLAVIASLVFVAISIIIFAIWLQKDRINLTIENNTLVVEIATTSQEKEKGLCCRDSLAQNAGMLFIYDKPGIYSFWMKDTRIPLDMYWINSQKEIVYIERNVQPDSFPKKFGPQIPVQYILETNAGYASKYNIQVGQTVTFVL